MLIEFDEDTSNNSTAVINKSEELTDMQNNYSQYSDDDIASLKEWGIFSGESQINSICQSSLIEYIFIVLFLLCKDCTYDDSNEETTTREAMYQIKKIHALSKNDLLKTYQDTISSTGRAIDTFKNLQITMEENIARQRLLPTAIATKNAVLAPANTRIATHTDNLTVDKSRVSATMIPKISAIPKIVSTCTKRSN